MTTIPAVRTAPILWAVLVFLSQHLHTAAQSCAAATYFNTATGQCNYCPLGWYSEGGSATSCTQCPPGTTCGLAWGCASINQCGCPGGYYGSNPLVSGCSPCPPNYYKSFLTPGPSTCGPCASGATNAAPNQDTCGCSAGSWSPDPRFTACSACPVNTYKPGFAYGGATCTSCPTGATTNGLTGRTSNANCGCPDGFYSSQSSTAGCTRCPANTYRGTGWVTGASSCTSCPASTTTNGSTGGTSINSCGCPDGYYSSNPQSVPCAACPVDTYRSGWTSLASNCTSCAAGATTLGATSSNSSLSCGCSAGYYSPNPATTACMMCPVDTFRALWQNGSSSCVFCPANATTNGQAGSDACGCGAGYGSANASTTACSLCPVDTYSSSWRSSVPASCASCDANTTTNGAVGSTSSAACICKPGYTGSGFGSCSACPVNTFKSSAGNGSCVACDANTTTNGLTGATTCVCKPGHFGSGYGACQKCPTNTYSSASGNGSQSTVCTSCPPNFFALAGSANCTNVCYPGSYKSGDNCLVCPANMLKTEYSNDTSCSTSCSSNFTTQGNTFADRDEMTDCACGAGHFSNVTENACSPCAQDTYKSGWGYAPCDACGAYETTDGRIGSTSCVCAAGYYGNASLDTCQGCPANTFKSAAGDGTVADCLACPTNHVTNMTSGATSCDACVAGYEMINGTCTPCPPDTFKNSSGTDSCAPCVVGQTTNGAVGSIACTQCAAGYYGVAAMGTCQGCPANTYKSTAGDGTIAVCIACPPNAFTSNSSAAVACDICSSGYEMMNGECSMCPPDTYKVTNGSQTCTSCPDNATTDGLTGATAFGQCGCPGGYFFTNVSSGNVSVLVCSPCPANTSRLDWSTDATSCIPCDDGFYAGHGQSVCERMQTGANSVGKNESILGMSPTLLYVIGGFIGFVAITVGATAVIVRQQRSKKRTRNPSIADPNSGSSMTMGARGMNGSNGTSMGTSMPGSAFASLIAPNGFTSYQAGSPMGPTRMNTLTTRGNMGSVPTMPAHNGMTMPTFGSKMGGVGTMHQPYKSHVAMQGPTAMYAHTTMVQPTNRSVNY